MTETYSEKEIGSMFDRIAPRYDFLNRLLSARQDERWRKVMARHIPYRPQGTLVDVATGTGDVLLAAGQSRTEYKQYLGVDISKEMLIRADQKMKLRQIKTPIPPCSFRQGSAEDLPVMDESADAVTISFGLRNVIDKKKGLKEFYRVLRAGGRLLVLEFFIPERGLGAKLFQFYFHKVLPIIGGIFSDRSAYEYLPRSVGRFYSPEAFRKELYETGFTVEREIRFLFGACRLFVADKRTQ